MLTSGRPALVGGSGSVVAAVDVVVLLLLSLAAAEGTRIFVALGVIIWPQLILFLFALSSSYSRRLSGRSITHRAAAKTSAPASATFPLTSRRRRRARDPSGGRGVKTTIRIWPRPAPVFGRAPAWRRDGALAAVRRDGRTDGRARAVCRPSGRRADRRAALVCPPARPSVRLSDRPSGLHWPVCRPPTVCLATSESRSAQLASEQSSPPNNSQPAHPPVASPASS